MKNSSPTLHERCPDQVTEALGLAERLFELADGSADSCGETDYQVFFGIVRDSAHAIRNAGTEAALERLMVREVDSPRLRVSE